MQRALLIVLIATSYLLLGGGPPWTRGPLLGIAALAALAAPRQTFRFPAETRALDLALVALLAAVTVQLLPLPATVAAALSPHAAGLYAATHFTFGAASPAWVALSIDPGATAHALAIATTGVLAFWASRAAFSGGASTRRFCRMLGWLGGAAAVVAVVQKAADSRMVMGLVLPDARNASPFGPFLNRNHFAAWMLLASAAAIGYLVAHLHIHPAYRSSRFRDGFRHFLASGAALSGICAVMCLGAMLMTLSRSAAAGLGAGALCAAWLGRSRLSVERTGLPAILGAVGTVVLLLVFFIDLEGWATRVQHSIGLDEPGLDRLTIWRESLPIARDFLLTGTGAGTYSLAMGQYQETRVWIGAMQEWAHFNNAHSHFMQVLTEGGLLVSVPAVVALALLVRLGVRSIGADKGEVFWIRLGAAAGLTGLAVQSIWEVALTMTANAVLAGALAGLMTFRRPPGRVSMAADRPLDTPL